MKKLERIILFLLIPLQISFGQSIEELKQVQKAYNDIVRIKQAEEALAKELGRDEVLIDEVPTKVLVKPQDILLYYSEKMARIQTELKDLEDLIPLINKPDKLPFYGYNYFFVRDTLTYWQNRPVSDNYPLGPGDEIIISLWGEAEHLVKQTISRDGSIIVENVGNLFLGGKTINEAKPYIQNRYAAVYSTIRGKKPSTFLDLSLGKLKGLNVQITGAVNAPGLYAINSLATVNTALTQAGGIDTTGSLRTIVILRNGSAVDTLDYYAFLNGKSRLNDSRLLERDIIHVPNRKSIVTIDGAIWQPAHFEMLPGETIKDLIGYAGGVRPNAGNTFVLVHRYNNNQQAEYVSSENINNILIENGDSLYIPIKQLPLLTVSIAGEVASIGTYPWFAGMTLMDLLQVAGFEYEKAYSSANMNAAELVRLQIDGGGFKPVTVDVSGLLSGNEESNIELYPYDRLTIPRKKDLMASRIVVIQGEVSAPGTYPLLHNQESLNSLLKRSGGVTELGFKEGISILRDGYHVGWSNENAFLVPGDTVEVPIKTGTIYVTGAVHNPGAFTWEKGKSIKYYLRLAGGINTLGDPKHIFIQYPNGQGAPVTFWHKPVVLEESKIHVSGKPFAAQTATTSLDIIQQFAGIAGSLATLVLIMNN
ncbi:MAG: SLBB domain-containing protein [Fidelibacterota bacterium]